MTEEVEVISSKEKLDPLKKALKLYRVLAAWRYLLQRTGMTSLGLAYVLKKPFREVQEELASGVDLGRTCVMDYDPERHRKRTHYYGHFCSVIKAPVWYPRQVDGGQCAQNRNGEEQLSKMKDVDTPEYKGVYDMIPQKLVWNVTEDDMVVLLYAKESIRNLEEMLKAQGLAVWRNSSPPAFILKEKKRLFEKFASKWEGFKAG